MSDIIDELNEDYYPVVKPVIEVFDKAKSLSNKLGKLIGVNDGGDFFGLGKIFSENDKLKKEEIKPSKEEMYSWLDGTIKEYTEKVLAWQINEICLRQNITMSVVDKIREKYGNEAVCPELNLRGKFDKYKNDKKIECLYSDLETVLKQWLDKNEVDYYGNNYEKEITSYIVGEAEQKAKEIIKQILKNNLLMM